MIFGRPVPRKKSLFSYVIPAKEADTEEMFLQQNMWLSRADADT